MKKALILTAALLASAQLSSIAIAAMSESDAKEIANDVATAIGAATGVIGSMQGDINSGKVDPAKAGSAAFQDAFFASYQKATGKAYDPKSAEYRTRLNEAIREVIDNNQKAIVKGGQDAFVPAYFRALVMKKFNASMNGKVSSYATTTTDSLINGDSAVDLILKGSPIQAEVAKLVNSSDPNNVDKVVGGHYMAYRPMTLKESCVACHARNGINGQVGGYGGALIIEVKM